MKVLVVRGLSAYDVLGRATDEICRGFENCGYEVDRIDTKAEYAVEALRTAAEHAEEYAFYFSMQAMFWDMEQKEMPWLKRVCRVGWIVDDPIYHAPRLAGTTGKNAHLLTIENGHAKRVREEYPQIERVGTLYHGGFYGGAMPEWNKKDIDVFFSGTYSPVSKAEWEMKQKAEVFRNIAHELKGELVGGKADRVWSEVLREYFRKISFEVSEEEFRDILEVMAPLEKYQRAWVRTRMIEELLKSGIEVTVVGNGWEDYAGEGKEHLHILAERGISINETVRLMGRSRIVLHCMNFFDGMHERIFTAMLANAVCVSYHYDTLFEFFREGEDIVTFPMTHMEELPQIVTDLLEYPDKAKAIAAAGFRVALEKHTWERRGEQIVEWMKKVR